MADLPNERKPARPSRMALASICLAVITLLLSIALATGTYVAIVPFSVSFFATLVFAIWGSVNVRRSRGRLRGTETCGKAAGFAFMGIAIGLLSIAMAQLHGRTDTQSANNLRQIGTAFHNHVSAYGEFPKNIVDENGRPLLSWRVEILENIIASALYKRFRLDEPWDSEHNKKLLDRMPPSYASPDKQAESGYTYYQAIIGPGTAFSAKDFDDFGRPSESSLLLAEAWTPVPWTKPADIVYDPNGPPPKLGGIFKPVKWYKRSIFHRVGANVLFLDNHIQFLTPEEMEGPLLRSLIVPPRGKTLLDPYKKQSELVSR